MVRWRMMHSYYTLIQIKKAQQQKEVFCFGRKRPQNYVCLLDHSVRYFGMRRGMIG